MAAGGCHCAFRLAEAQRQDPGFANVASLGWDAWTNARSWFRNSQPDPCSFLLEEFDHQEDG